MNSVALPPAIVLGGNANAVSVARTLGRWGVEVTAFGNGADQVRHSRWCTSFVDVGPGLGVGDRWLARLLDRPRDAVLLPCDDDALELIGRHRAELIAVGYRPVEADDEVVLAMLNKETTYRLARSAGISTPLTVPLIDDAAVERAIERLGFPSALKPVHSHRFQKHFGGRKSYVVSDADEFRTHARSTRAHGLEMIATEIIPGRDDRLCSYYSYIDESGRPLVGLTKRKIRQQPSGFGLGSMEVTDHAPDVAEAGAAFFAAIGLRGLANVEFKRDARDGSLRLIECNHRFTASNELVRVAGVDLARLAYARVASVPLPRLDHYRTGLTLWNPLRDVRSSAGAVRRGEAPLGEWLSGLARPHVLPVFRLDDPLPTIAHHAGLIRRLPGKVGLGRSAGQAPAHP